MRFTPEFRLEAQLVVDQGYTFKAAAMGVGK